MKKRNVPIHFASRNVSAMFERSSYHKIPRPWPGYFILVGVALAAATEAGAQAGNATYTLLQEGMISGGGRVGGGNPMSAQTALGLPASGRASNERFILIGGVTLTNVTAASPITYAVTVTGTIDDPTASVTVNGIAAAVSGTTFTAAPVLLLLGPNTLTATATDALGNTASASISVSLDLPEAKKTPRFSITVTGAVDDPAASVTVNGVPATVAAGAFTARVPLTSGFNALTAIATDPEGNTATASIRVFVPLPARPPAMPTVGTVGPPIPTVTTTPALTLGGTKTPGTSIWIAVNGGAFTQAVPLGDGTTWTLTMTLMEGDNELLVITKDITGAASATVRVLIVLDTLPPVVTFQPPEKMNVTPAALTGTVDDSLTIVTINGVTTARLQRAFEISVPLALGPNALHLIATSPNGHVTTRDDVITRGTVPTIQSAQPADRAKLYAGSTATLQATAHDAEGDPIQYRFALDGEPLAEWSPSASQPWAPGLSQLGIHALTISVRDPHGGSSDMEAKVFVVRPPIQPPSP